MPKTDITKPRNEDLAELSDEALDRTAEGEQLCGGGVTRGCTGSPAE